MKKQPSPEYRADCTPDAPIPTHPVKKIRKYTGPAKGSDEAKDRMAKVRAAQWAKNGLVVSNPVGNGANA
jgi:hypothetical protein